MRLSFFYVHLEKKISFIVYRLEMKYVNLN
ncbi:hypothetical protein SAMN04488573_1011171 [Bacillus sp. 5mfcol3.1]|nr:hypothetical protein SAMN04488573_1011171 [Bacillus sp. 5mfcol3.1]